jgi:arsenical pump membrane protein
VQEAAAVSALALTLGLTLRRPRLSSGLRIGPGIAAALGVSLAVVFGDITVGDVGDAADVLWRPFIALVALMTITGVAGRMGIVERWAAVLVTRSRGSPRRLFGLVFVLSLATAAILNNDAAILLLTPAVVLLVRRLYPDEPALLVPFAFAVFMAAGVAPFVTSNPMNTVVASAAGIDFNAYAARMVPVAFAGAVVTFLVLRRVFAAELARAPAVPEFAPPSPPFTPAQRHAVALIVAVLAAYPLCALLGVQVFAVAAAGAAGALWLARRHGIARPVEVVRRDVAWEVLAFLFGMFLLAEALQNVGVVDRLADLYEDGGIALTGAVSAVGSALVNNHAMALTNLLALDAQPGALEVDYLAALVGGDLGPRLLPVGSLAGLLWIALLRGLSVEVPLRRFVTVGLAVTLPSLAVSLGALALLA